MCAQKDYIWNPSTCTCENDEKKLICKVKTSVINPPFY